MKAGVLNEFGTPFSQDEFKEFDTTILPEMFQLAAEHELYSPIYNSIDFLSQSAKIFEPQGKPLPAVMY